MRSNAQGIFRFEDEAMERRAEPLLRRLPCLSGTLIRIQIVRGLRDSRGAVHAGALLRRRRIAFNCTRAEFPRIFTHEVGHFIWVRLGNPVRLSYEELLRTELEDGARGELGWSAEWRKAALTTNQILLRTRRWREYCCESFCDTAAWRYSGVRRHSEFTLAARFRRRRQSWFAAAVDCGGLSI